jgi:hypothetical protein
MTMSPFAALGASIADIVELDPALIRGRKMMITDIVGCAGAPHHAGPS